MTIPGSAIPLLLSQAGDAQYEIKKSCRFDGGDSAYLSRTPTSAGNRKTFTLSAWVKAPDVANTQQIIFSSSSGSTPYTSIDFRDNNLRLVEWNGSSVTYQVKTNAVFRDASAWFHVVFAVDTTQSTAADRVKIYVNGVQETSLAEASYPSQNHDTYINSSTLHNIGNNAATSYNAYLNGYLADVYFIDGYIKEASDFGETDSTTGQWVPKEYEDGLTEVTSVVPTGFTYWAGMSENWESGGTTSSGNDWIDTALPSDTKVYWETKLNTPSYYNQIHIWTGASGTGTGWNSSGIGYYFNVANGANATFNASDGDTNFTVGNNMGVTFATGSILMWAWDPINDKLWLGHNGTWFGGGDPATGSSPTVYNIDFSANDYYFKQGRTSHVNTTTQTNRLQSEASYFESTDNLNSFHLAMDPDNTNNGSHYSDQLSLIGGTAWNADPYGKDAGFNGKVDSSYAQQQGGTNPNSITFTPTGGIAYSSKVEVYIINDENQVSVNGGTLQTIAQNAWVTVASGSGTLTSLKFERASTSGSSFSGIRIDGKHLVDHSTIGCDSSGNDHHWTENNLDVDRTTSGAGGANPIYNTSAYGQLKESGYRTDSSAGTTDGTGLILAMPGDTITDLHASVNTGSSNNSFTTVGTVATTTTRSQFYGTSMNFGTSDGNYLKTTSSNSDFAFGTGAFTIEAWYYITDTSSWDQGFLQITATEGPGSYTQSGGITIYTGSGSGGTHNLYTGNTYASFGSHNSFHSGWHHFAGTRDADGVMRVFVDGVMGSRVVTSTENITATYLNVGTYGSSSYSWHGQIQDLRLYKGVCKYTGNFSIPATGPTTDIVADVPGAPYDNGLNGGGNYATWNPLRSLSTFAQGNLAVTSHSSGTYNTTATTLGMTSGKWYCEMTPSATGGTNNAYGIINDSTNTNDYLGTTTGTDSSMGLWDNGGTYRNGSYTDSSYCSAFQTGGEVVGLAFDVDNGTLKFYINGVDQGNAWTDIPAGTWHFCVTTYQTTTTEITLNCGQRAFAYTPPTGYKALNTYNLPDPTIKDPSKHFEPKEYTGTGSTHAITGLNFSPDLVWLKKYTTASHAVFDTVRGVQERLETDSTDAEGADATTLTAFGTEGFTLSTHDDVNQNTDGYVSWNWDGGTANTSVSAGAYDSTLYDTSEDWSGSNGSAAAFEGDFYSAGLSVGTSAVNLTSIGFSVTSTISVWINNPSGIDVILGYNGTDYTETNPTDFGWTDFTVPSSTNSGTLTVKLADSGDECRGVKIDGKILIDSDVTPPNVPSIASTYRANPNAGFSIVSYTGNGGNTSKTVAHGLNATPDFLLVKSRDSTTGWMVHHSSRPGKIFYLHTNDAEQTSTALNTPNSNTITVGDTWTNATDDSYIAYCWSEVAGYSKFSSYTGNGSADGPFVWCGFTPTWLMIKRTDNAGQHWVMWDSARDSINPNTQWLYANSPAANGHHTDQSLDFLSNGFKPRDSNWNMNTNNANYIFIAFAESPFKYANAR